MYFKSNFEMLEFLNNLNHVSTRRIQRDTENLNIVTCLATEGAIRIVTWFYKPLTGLTTITYYTIACLHNLQSLHTNLLTLSAVVFMYSVSLNQALQIEPSIHTISLQFTRRTSRGCHLKLEQSQIHRRIILRKFTPGTVRELPANSRCLQGNLSARTPRKIAAPLFLRYSRAVS
jgi:hypothetical protein